MKITGGKTCHGFRAIAAVGISLSEHAYMAHHTLRSMLITFPPDFPQDWARLLLVVDQCTLYFAPIGPGVKIHSSHLRKSARPVCGNIM